MVFLQQVAIAIHPSIKVTLDFPSSHENGRLPVLDVEQWIGDVLVDGMYKKQILHSHYTVYPKAAKRIIPSAILVHIATTPRSLHSAVTIPPLIVGRWSNK